LRKGLQGLGLDLDESQTEQLLAYLDLLDRWNRAYNLTAVRDPLARVTRHLLDALSVLPWIGPGRLLDAGAGAGLPGIPLAIARPDIIVTLVDSAGKKVRFMNHVKRELRLENIQPVHARVESLEAGEPFGTVISRAFSSLAAFVAAVRHLCNGKTRLLAMKGRYPEDEILELPDWARVGSVEKLAVPGLHEQRHLVIMSARP
jgi:16S rRNA (guanine527-N7)-methyltransferase